MKKRLLLVAILVLSMVQLAACGSKVDTDDVKTKAKPAPVVSLRNPPDDSKFDRVPEKVPEYVTGGPIYGMTCDVPSYMHRSEDAGTGYLVYVDHDENPVRYVSCQVTSDAWSDVELKDLADIGYEDVVFEDMTGNDGDGYRRSAHYFFVTDRTNAGEHEMQVLVSVTADSEASCNETLERIMRSMDFSEFYFDGFAE